MGREGERKRNFSGLKQKRERPSPLRQGTLPERSNLMATPFNRENSKGKYLSQGQERMISSALTNILTNAESLQRKPGLTQEEKGSLEEIKKDTYGIARIIKQAKSGRS